MVWWIFNRTKPEPMLRSEIWRGFLPGPSALWTRGWQGWPHIAISHDDAGGWPCCTSLRIKFSAFLETLHWPCTVDYLGLGGASSLEMLILYETLAGERLSIKLADPRNRMTRRPISVSGVPFGLVIDTWRSCRFLGSMFRALSDLPGSTGRFHLCNTGAKHCTSRHLGWEQCGHGLTSRPRETADLRALGPLLVLLGCHLCASDLLAGTLKLRYAGSRSPGSFPHGPLGRKCCQTSHSGFYGIMC